MVASHPDAFHGKAMSDLMVMNLDRTVFVH